MNKCGSCGHEVSPKAEKCPQCGHPIKRKPVGCLGGLALIAVVFVGAVIVSTERDPATKPAPAVDCSAQDGRGAFVQKMVDQGYWQKVEKPSSLYRVHVLPAFTAEATFDDKQTFISTVAALDICDGGDGIVSVVDAMTGKEIGVFSNGRLNLE